MKMQISFDVNNGIVDFKINNQKYFTSIIFSITKAENSAYYHRLKEVWEQTTSHTYISGLLAEKGCGTEATPENIKMGIRILDFLIDDFNQKISEIENNLVKDGNYVVTNISSKGYVKYIKKEEE